MTVQEFPGEFGIAGERSGRSAARWGGCALLVAGLHAGLGAGLFAWETPVAPVTPPPAALMIEMAPLPAAPQEVAKETPPAPEPVLDLPPPELPPEPVIEPEPLPEPPPEPVAEPVVEPVVEPEPVPTPAPEPEVVLPAEKPKPPAPKPVPPRVERAKPEPRKEPRPAPPKAPAAAPALPVPDVAPVAAAPAPGPASTQANRAPPSWQGLLLGHLERHKRYPRMARSRRQEGVAQVRFTMDRQGKVLSVSLAKSSGFKALDEETIAMVERASPLPPIPPGVGGDRMELVVPVQFFIR
ncbi:energy transducer TonB [Azospirillum sp. SYSU D00513]|uniref:energy transducer TonB family protein n=1 Tax=Azospirillum sp. SYSU D00513 TaxID=2812561 RepID=UPI001A977C98|nr:energy transducer TonB [Azospirillum sp. SYSU D00513]